MSEPYRSYPVLSDAVEPTPRLSDGRLACCWHPDTAATHNLIYTIRGAYPGQADRPVNDPACGPCTSEYGTCTDYHRVEPIGEQL